MFFDAFSFAFPAALQRIPYSVLVSLIWTVITYFPVGLAPQPSRWAPYNSGLCWCLPYFVESACCAALCWAMMSVLYKIPEILGGLGPGHLEAISYCRVKHPQPAKPAGVLMH